MKYQLAQLNIARFLLPQDDSVNQDFLDSLDAVNAVAEAHEGFVWRFVGEGNSAVDVQAYEDPNIIVNMSVWTDLEHLAAFVYRNKDHTGIMRRRKEWFEKIESRMVLWWVPEGHTPSVQEGTERLQHLTEHGPSAYAFTFKKPFPPAEGNKAINPILDECA